MCFLRQFRLLFNSSSLHLDFMEPQSEPPSNPLLQQQQASSFSFSSPSSPGPSPVIAFVADPGGGTSDQSTSLEQAKLLARSLGDVSWSCCLLWPTHRALLVSYFDRRVASSALCLQLLHQQQGNAGAATGIKGWRVSSVQNSDDLSAALAVPVSARIPLAVLSALDKGDALHFARSFGELSVVEFHGGAAPSLTVEYHDVRAMQRLLFDLYSACEALPVHVRRTLEPFLDSKEMAWLRAAKRALGGRSAYGSESTIPVGGPRGGSQQQQGSGQPLVSKNSQLSSFTVDCSLVERGLETRTTVMIRNIPNKLTQQKMIGLIDEVACKNGQHDYDFFYLPIDVRHKCNVGYAFINFVDPRLIIPFYKEFHGCNWRAFNSKKICELSFARLQGKDALIRHFASSNMLQNPTMRPVFLPTTSTERLRQQQQQSLDRSASQLSIQNSLSAAAAAWNSPTPQREGAVVAPHKPEPVTETPPTSPGNNAGTSPGWDECLERLSALLLQDSRTQAAAE